jgi:hypothetical protein
LPQKLRFAAAYEKRMEKATHVTIRIIAGVENVSISSVKTNVKKW